MNSAATAFRAFVRARDHSYFFRAAIHPEITSSGTRALHLVIPFASALWMLIAMPDTGLARGFLENIGHEAGSCLHGGCDVIWSLNQRFDKGLSSKVESLAGPAKQAFEEAADYLFKNELDPFLSRVDSLTEARIAQIDKVFQDAIAKAETATNNTIDRVRSEIILTASEEIKKIADEILNDVKCALFVTSAEAQRFIDNNFTIFGNLRRTIGDLFNKCAPLDQNNYYSIYFGRKCQYDIQIASSNTVEGLRTSYLEYLEFSSRSICLLSSPKAKQEVASHVSEYARHLDLWSLALK
jgi:hypothetical protein